MTEDARSGNLQKTYKAPRRPDLFTRAIPRYDLLNFDNYVIPPFAKTPLIAVQTARGCPHQCDFCSVTAFLGHAIRKKPIAHVLKEIETIRPSRILFSDDNIGADPEHAKELFEVIKPLKIRWACQMSTTIAKHSELIELAAEAGCHETFIGIESLKENALAGVRKGFNKVSEYKDLFRRLKDVGILSQASFVFGLDGDTVDSLKRTIDTVLDWDINYIYIYSLTPFPGTRTRQKMEREHRMVSEDWSLYDATHPLVKYKNMTAEDLVEIVWDTYQKFYSAKNIFKRAWRFKKQYVCFFPRDFVVEEIFFSLLVRKSVNMKEHPFTLGLVDSNKKRNEGAIKNE